jgi:hypothetical protein
MWLDEVPAGVVDSANGPPLHPPVGAGIRFRACTLALVRN